MIARRSSLVALFLTLSVAAADDVTPGSPTIINNGQGQSWTQDTTLTITTLGTGQYISVSPQAVLLNIPPGTQLQSTEAFVNQYAVSGVPVAQGTNTILNKLKYTGTLKAQGAYPGLQGQARVVWIYSKRSATDQNYKAVVYAFSP